MEKIYLITLTIHNCDFEEDLEAEEWQELIKVLHITSFKNYDNAIEFLNNKSELDKIFKEKFCDLYSVDLSIEHNQYIHYHADIIELELK